MKKQTFLFILFIVLVGNKALSQETSIFPRGEKSPDRVHHTGNVWLKELNAADSIFTSNIAVATLDAGAKLDWHKHPGGQILMVTNGEGYYQEKGKPKQVIQKGDVIKCLPDVEHWHGATPESGVTYLASSPSQKGKTIWLQRVTEEEYNATSTTPTKSKNIEKELLELSKTKWRWMADRNIEELNALFNEKAIFVHMGGTMNKEIELNIIKTGTIQYKNTEIQESSVQFINDTAIVLNKIRLTAIVGGNEVVNPFSVTEVYIHLNGNWSLGSMSFTKLLTP